MWPLVHRAINSEDKMNFENMFLFVGFSEMVRNRRRIPPGVLPPTPAPPGVENDLYRSRGERLTLNDTLSLSARVLRFCLLQQFNFMIIFTALLEKCSHIFVG